MLLLPLTLQVSGSYRDLPRPVDMEAMFTLGSVSSTGYLFPFNIGSEVTIKVCTASCWLGWVMGGVNG